MTNTTAARPGQCTDEPRDLPSRDLSLREIHAGPEYNAADIEREYALPAPSTHRRAMTPRVVPGVLAQEVRVPRPKTAILETLIGARYQYTPHDARVMVRLLDSAHDYDRATEIWAVTWASLLASFRAANGRDPDHFRIIQALDRLEQMQVASIIPGHRAGVACVFISTYDHRSTLAYRVLARPNDIPIRSLGQSIVDLAKESLAA